MPNEAGTDAVYDPRLATAYPDAPQPEYLLLEWIADSRVVIRRSREFYSSASVIVLLFSLILLSFNQITLIVVMLAILFITYVLSTVKAEDVVHQITTYGIRYQGRLYYWGQMGRFWVQMNHGVPEVHVEAPVFVANRMILLAANARSPEAVSVDDIVDALGRYLPYEEPLPTQVDKWVKWLSEKFPLESNPPQG